MTTHTSSSQQFLTPEQAASALGITTAELAARRRGGTAPRWLQLSRKCVRYEPLDVLKTPRP